MNVAWGAKKGKERIRGLFLRLVLLRPEALTKKSKRVGAFKKIVEGENISFSIVTRRAGINSLENKKNRQLRKMEIEGGGQKKGRWSIQSLVSECLKRVNSTGGAKLKSSLEEEGAISLVACFIST